MLDLLTDGLPSNRHGCRLRAALLALALAAAPASCGDDEPAGSAVPDEGIIIPDVAGDDAPDAVSPADEGAQPGDTASDAAPEAAGTDIEQDAGPPCGGECAPELCVEEAGVCLECTGHQHCEHPAYCKNNECVTTTCFPKKVECVDDKTLGTCSDDGETLATETCPGEQVCAWGQCRDVVCEPGEMECEYFVQKKCDEKGTGWGHFPCPPGQACFYGACQSMRNNVVVVFDTSGSMFSMGMFDLDTVNCLCPAGCKEKPFPACEDIDCPRSKLGLSKHAFKGLLESEEIGLVNLAMLRFPQVVVNQPNKTCAFPIGPSFSSAQGWFSTQMSTDHMSGDNDAHMTGPDGYFDKNLHEVLCVHFPTSLDDTTLAELWAWIDGDEAVAPTETPCKSKGDCPGGFCAAQDGVNVCHFHTNPELRALGNTPLGRTMFYAGEYIRKHVVVDGKPCDVHADCKNVNYFCHPKNKVCFDPLRTCRKNAVVVLTDGVEEPPTQPSDFFNPHNQAKRLRYGLGCSTDGQCGTGAKCIGGLCRGYLAANNCPDGTIADDCPSYPMPMFDDPQGINRLYAFDGSPIEVTTHTIYIHQPSESEGKEANRDIADDGGGIYFDVDTDEPSALLDAFKSFLDVKQNLSACIPKLPEE